MALDSPIVFLPGIMGTRLYFPDTKRYWDPDSPRRMFWWLWSSDDRNRRAMHARQQAELVETPGDRHIDDEQAKRGWGTLVWSFYDTLMPFLEEVSERPAYALGYDWRQDLFAVGADARNRIDAIRRAEGAEKVTLVTHSMGGLVVRAALRDDPGFNDRVARTVHICQPSAGAVLLYRRLFTGLPRRYDSGWGFRHVLGTDRATFVANMSGLPGAMQLLPSKEFPLDPVRPWNPSMTSGADPNDLYSQAGSPPGLNPPAEIPVNAEVIADFRDRLTDTRRFHERLGTADNDTADRNKTWLVYGADRLTEVAVSFDRGEVTPVSEKVGDTVVPAVSALALNLPRGRTFVAASFRDRTGNHPMDHDSACNHPEVQRIVRSILRL